MDLDRNGVDDLVQLRNFIDDVGTDLLEAAQAAWEWLKAELLKLGQMVVDALTKAVRQALASYSEARPIDAIVADTLNVLYREAREIADQISSDVIRALVSLTAAPKIAPVT